MEARRPLQPDVGRRPLVVTAAGALGVVLAVLAAGIAQELSIALRTAAAVAADPSTRDETLAAVGILALLAAGMGLCFAGVVVHVRIPNALAWLVALLNGAAVALVLARDLTYDVYDGSATRYIGAGAVRPAWIAVLAVLAALASTLVRRFPGAGLFGSGLFLWLCALSALLAGFLLH